LAQELIQHEVERLVDRCLGFGSLLGIIAPFRPWWLAFWLAFQPKACLSLVRGIDGDEELEMACRAQEAAAGVLSALAFEEAFPSEYPFSIACVPRG
jgi:hypothetical protein